MVNEIVSHLPIEGLRNIRYVDRTSRSYAMGRIQRAREETQRAHDVHLVRDLRLMASYSPERTEDLREAFDRAPASGHGKLARGLIHRGIISTGWVEDGRVVSGILDDRLEHYSPVVIRGTVTTVSYDDERDVEEGEIKLDGHPSVREILDAIKLEFFGDDYRPWLYLYAEFRGNTLYLRFKHTDRM